MNTSPVDTLKALRVFANDNSKAALDAAIAALSGGDAWEAAGIVEAIQHGRLGGHEVFYTTPRAVGDGMVVVPREPTGEMVQAAHEESHCGNGSEHIREVWAAMIAAAPSEGSAPINYQSADSRLIVDRCAQGASTGQVPEIRPVVIGPAKMHNDYLAGPFAAGSGGHE